MTHLTKIAPIIVALMIALWPVPDGLAQHAWYYFAIFSGVIVALMFEPIPGGAVGLIGVTLITVLSPWVLYSPQELIVDGFQPANEAINWALSGFSNSTVWLIFGAFMFALGYDRTGLGRRVALLLVRKMGGSTLKLGYAIVVTDLMLAPFTPSNTARSGGTIYPVIRNLPPLYNSFPNTASARRIGSYLMWVAITTTCVTSSMFLTSLAPNLLAVELVKKTTGITLNWTQWFVAFLPLGLLLLALIPLMVYWIYPPEVKEGKEVPQWANNELLAMGKLSFREIQLLILVVLALVLWIVGGSFINATTTALVVISLMLLLKILTWEDVIANKAAWNTLAWFATLVALANGLNKVGFVGWFASWVAFHLSSLSPTSALVVLVLIFFFSHYLFASVTAHVTALLPVMLSVGLTLPGMNMEHLSYALCLTLGIMGIISPYATGSGPVYYGSGYLPASDYWRLGGIFGLLFAALFLVIGLPWLIFLH